MQLTKVAHQLRAQLHQFPGIFSPHFSKPQAAFIEEMLFGLSASQDCKLSAISHAPGEPITLKKTAERLTHHLAAPQLGPTLHQQIVAHAARHIHPNTLIVVDPTDIRKPYAEKMPHLATVRDGSTGELVTGYGACLALACEPTSRRVWPLMQQLWSAETPDFVSENAQLLGLIDPIAAATAQPGIDVVDRGGDRIELYKPLLERGLRFIIRLRGDRHLVVRGRARTAEQIAQGVRMQYAETVVRESPGGEKKVHGEYGYRRVKWPGRKNVELTLVVGRGFGEKPLLLLTNVTVKNSRRSVWGIVSGSLRRWLVEGTIRFIKQSYRLEGLRVLAYERLRNLAALLVVAAASCAAVWLVESWKLAVLTSRVTKVAKRFFGVPEFHYDALADGLRVLLSRLGMNCVLCRVSRPATVSAPLPPFNTS